MKSLLSFLVLALLSAGCANSRPKAPAIALGPHSTPEKAVTITSRERGTFVALKPKGVVTVELESNRSAGYHWKLAQPLDAGVLELVSPTPNPLPPIALPPENVTRPQAEKWVFKAVGPGTTKVRLIYSRLDQPLKDAVFYNFTVNAE